MTTPSGISDTQSQEVPRPKFKSTASIISDAPPRPHVQPKSMTPTSGVSDVQLQVQSATLKAPPLRPGTSIQGSQTVNTAFDIFNKVPRPRLPVPEPAAPFLQLPRPILQSQVLPTPLSPEKPKQQPTVRVSGFSLKEEPMESLDGHHLIIKYTTEDSLHRLKSHSLVDCGASGFAFFNKDYAHHHDLPLHSLKEPRYLKVIDE